MAARSKRILLAFHWYSEALHEGALKYCVERGWSAAVLNTDTIGEFPPGGFDGIIGMLPPAGHPVYEFVTHAGLPVVELSYAHPERKEWVRCPSDGAAVGRMAAEHLRRRPVAAFAFVANSRWPNHVVRRDGFLNALAAAGDLRPVSVYYTGTPGDLPFDTRPDMGAPDPAATSRLAAQLKTLPLPVGIFGSVDSIARQVLDAATEADLKIPGDIYLVGFNNRDLVSRLSPVPITGITIDCAAWAYAAAGMLEDLMEGRIRPGALSPFPPNPIVERESTGGESGGNPLCARALDIMRERIAEAPDVAEISACLGVSKSTLNRAFTETYGEGVAHRYLELRMSMAKGLLAAGEKVESVSSSVGFSSSRAFGEAFRKAVGCTPGEFAKRRPVTPARDRFALKGTRYAFASDAANRAPGG